MSDRPIDLEGVRAHLAKSRGKEYWRCLDELAETPEFEELLHREFPRQASVWEGSFNRRTFLKLMGASLALAGLASCYVPPKGTLVPYVKQPENVLPGRPLYFATAMTLGGYGLGLLAESNLGRPTKLEGNPDHPASLGATDAFAQASILNLYDPDRSQVVLNKGAISTWSAILQVLTALIDSQRGKGGAGLRILTETVTSPTLANQMQEILKALPKAKWHQWEPVNDDNARAGQQMAFGQYVESVYHFDKADIILSLDSDFMVVDPGGVRYTRDLAPRRRPGSGGPLSRIYAVESTMTLTGAKADHRLPLRVADIENMARAIAAGLGVQGAPTQAPANVPAKWIPAVVRDLQAHKGASVVIAGGHLSPYTQALVHAMNDALGNAGKTITYTDPVQANPGNQLQSLVELANEMKSGAVDLLLIIGGNPVYNAPADLNFGQAISKVGTTVRMGLYDDETSALSHWHIPQTHFLEEWSDTRAFDGTASIVQPLIAPLYSGKSPHELLAPFTGNSDTPGHDIVQSYWRSKHRGRDFDTFWRTSLNNGVIAGTAAAGAKNVKLKTDWIGHSPLAPQSNGLEIVFRPDPSTFDGRFANNGWLQELPKPFSKITWDNTANVSPTTAQQLHLNTGDVVELRYRGGTLRAPVYVMPGHADGSVTVQLGYGRTRGGKVMQGVGYNAYVLRTSAAPSFDMGLEIVNTGTGIELATTQRHNLIEGRGLVRSATVEEFQKNPHFAAQEDPVNPPMSLYPGYKYEGYRWGMAIDLSTCVGCNACVIACQAENNIPVVGRDQVIKEREMHWLRVDAYYSGNMDNPTTNFQPVPCMQCEAAPCELVCPVQATAHSAEGLNDMTYNRCVGTRYCSNNCPYKVRHFNFFQYSDWSTPSLKLLYNPDVTVRERGVMEKCTYCVQRINRARIHAEEQGRPIKDGEVITACAAACPADAIIFGDINDPNSRVAKLKADPRNYAMLAELNTRPRTTYEAAIRNPNPELA